MFNSKQQDVYNNILNVMKNISNQIKVPSHAKIIYDDLDYIIDYTFKFCKKNNIKFYDLDLLNYGFEFDEIDAEGNIIEPIWYKIQKEKDIYILVYNIDEISTRSLAYKQLLDIIKIGKIRGMEISIKAHFIFITNRDIPMDNVIETDLLEFK